MCHFDWFCYCRCIVWYKTHSWSSHYQLSKPLRESLHVCSKMFSDELSVYINAMQVLLELSKMADIFQANFAFTGKVYCNDVWQTELASWPKLENVKNWKLKFYLHFHQWNYRSHCDYISTVYIRQHYFSLVICFNDISTLVGYLMLNTVYTHIFYCIQLI